MNTRPGQIISVVFSLILHAMITSLILLNSLLLLYWRIMFVFLAVAVCSELVLLAQWHDLLVLLVVLLGWPMSWFLTLWPCIYFSVVIYVLFKWSQFTTESKLLCWTEISLPSFYSTIFVSSNICQQWFYVLDIHEETCWKSIGGSVLTLLPQPFRCRLSGHVKGTPSENWLYIYRSYYFWVMLFGFLSASKGHINFVAIRIVCLTTAMLRYQINKKHV